MKNTLRNIFHSGKFVAGFIIFMFLLVMIIVYPLLNPGSPLEQIGVGTFAKPGTYVSLYDAAKTNPDRERETLRLSDADDKRLPQLARQLQKDMPYFGYGYIKDRAELVPYIPVNFYAFRVMVGVGMLLLLFFLVIGHVAWRQDITRRGRSLWTAALLMLPLAYIASEAGWIVAELGRQPWAIQDMLPTVAAVSDLKSGSVALTFFIFLILFTLLLIAEIRIMCRVIKNYKSQTVNI